MWTSISPSLRKHNLGTCQDNGKDPIKTDKLQVEEAESNLLEEKCDALIKIYNVQELLEVEQAKQWKNAICTDQMGKLPHVSSRGHKYQMVLYHIDSNAI